MRSDGAYSPTAVIAGLVPATPIMWHGLAMISGVAGTRPYEGVLR
jgi:hypothetical protein